MKLNNKVQYLPLSQKSQATETFLVPNLYFQIFISHTRHIRYVQKSIALCLRFHGSFKAILCGGECCVVLLDHGVVKRFVGNDWPMS